MKFEKLNENKIRITLTSSDFEEKHIDFHSFMSNPLESQDLFLEILEEAKNKIGFNTSDYRVKIEALAMIDGDFIINVTRIHEKLQEKPKSNTEKKKFTVKRKSAKTNLEKMVYKFNTFDDYCNFIEYISKSNLTKSYLIAKKIIVYIYRNKYYMVFYNINSNSKKALNLYSSIIEFGTYVSSSNLLISKLEEHGKIVVKNNALKISLKHYAVEQI